jgi:hypothetical protein
MAGATKTGQVKKTKAAGTKEKRPLTPYLKFVSEQMSILKAENPGKKAKELMTMIGAKWKTDPQNPKNAK